MVRRGAIPPHHVFNEDREDIKMEFYSPVYQLSDCKTSVPKLPKSLLHDIIKSCIHVYPKDIIDICKTIPSIKNSNLINECNFKFVESRQEATNTKLRQVDVVWGYSDTKQNKFFIVHEVKTGFYDVREIHKKYHSGMNVQEYVWVLHSTLQTPPTSMKILPISYISNFVRLHTLEALSFLEEGSQ